MTGEVQEQLQVSGAEFQLCGAEPRLSADPEHRTEPASPLCWAKRNPESCLDLGPVDTVTKIQKLRTFSFLPPLSFLTFVVVCVFEGVF